MIETLTIGRIMIVLNKDAPCGERTLEYCRYYCDWPNCKHISDETRYERACIGQGIEKQT